MSETKTIVILANSIRSGHRCIAGKELRIKTDGAYQIGPWIRLADHSTKEGAVPVRIACCQNHGWVKPLDIVQVQLESPCFNPDHPEDWWLEPNKLWQFIETWSMANVPLLADRPQNLWYAADPDAVPAGYIRAMGQRASSLYLIQAPEKWRFTYQRHYNPFKRCDQKSRKLELALAGRQHEFSVTDPEFDHRFKLPAETSRWSGFCTNPTVPNPAGCYFCLSLTPVFNGKHYKICATLFET
jgi:hypothetical protein